VLLFRKRNVANSKCRSLISSYRPLVLFTLSLFAHWLFARWPALRTSLHQPRSLTSLTHSSDLEPLVLFELLRSSALGFLVTISIPEMHKLLRQAIARLAETRTPRLTIDSFRSENISRKAVHHLIRTIGLRSFAHQNETRCANFGEVCSSLVEHVISVGGGDSRIVMMSYVAQAF
jgi:hypothetical protein